MYACCCLLTHDFFFFLMKFPSFKKTVSPQQGHKYVLSLTVLIRHILFMLLGFFFFNVDLCFPDCYIFCYPLQHVR